MLELALGIAIPIAIVLGYVFVAGTVWPVARKRLPVPSYDDPVLALLATVFWPLTAPVLIGVWVFRRPVKIKQWWVKRREQPEELVEELAETFYPEALGFEQQLIGLYRNHDYAEILQLIHKRMVSQ